MKKLNERFKAIKYKQYYLGLFSAVLLFSVFSIIPQVVNKVKNYSSLELTKDYDYINENYLEMDGRGNSKSDSYGSNIFGDYNINFYDQKMIYTSSISLEVKDSENVVKVIEDFLESSKGYIENINSYTSPPYDYIQNNQHYMRGEARTYSIVVRVPAENLSEFTQNMEGLGKVINYSKSASNVTSQFADLEARLNLSKSKLKRLNQLVEETGSLSELITLEKAISEEIYEIDRIQSQLKGLNKQVSYSTIHLDITESQEATLTVTKINFFDEIKSTFIYSFNSFIKTLVSVMKGIIYLVPYILILVICFIIFKSIKNKRY